MPRARGVQEGGIPALVLDVLQTNWGSWHTYEEVCWEVQRIRPHVTTATVRRAIQRLVESGEVSLREGAGPATAGHMMRGSAKRTDFNRIAILHPHHYEEAI